MLIKVFSVLSMLSKLPPGVCWRGGAGADPENERGGCTMMKESEQHVL